MIDPRFVFVAILFNLWGSTAYSISTIQGKTKPNRVTWFLLAVAPMIAFSAELGSGGGLESVMTFMVGFGPLLVFISSFINPKSYWRISRFDLVCGAISVLALIGWLVTGTGMTAIILSILADFLAFVPTFKKAFIYPETENAILYRNGSISATITLLSIQDWKPSTYLFPFYILAACFSTYLIVRFKLGQRYLSAKATT